MSSSPKVEDVVKDSGSGARTGALLVLLVLADNVEWRLDVDADASAARAGGMTVEAISSVVPSLSAAGCNFLEMNAIDITWAVPSSFGFVGRELLLFVFLLISPSPLNYDSASYSNNSSTASTSSPLSILLPSFCSDTVRRSPPTRRLARSVGAPELGLAAEKLGGCVGPYK